MKFKHLKVSYFKIFGFMFISFIFMINFLNIDLINNRILSFSLSEIITRQEFSFKSNFEGKLVNSLDSFKNVYLEHLNSQKFQLYSKVTVLIFYGRKDKVKILLRYIDSALKKNGGVIDNVIFAVKTGVKEDLDFLKEFLEKNPNGYSRFDFVQNVNFKNIYTILPYDDLVFKIDDDIVFISNGTFKSMIDEFIKNRHLILSANVINHPQLSLVHQKNGAFLKYQEKNLSSIFRDSRPWWQRPECADIAHENFFDQVNNLNVFDFDLWNLHEKGYQRWSINFILTKGFILNKFLLFFENGDDEEILSNYLPNFFKINCKALGKALVSHFTYFRQIVFTAETKIKYSLLFDHYLKSYDNFSISYLNI